LWKPTLLTSYRIWPLVNIVNFAFVPAPLRLLVVNSFSVGWIVFLSMVGNARTSTPAVTINSLAFALAA
jgi:Mpv17 / PMP22 family